MRRAGGGLDRAPADLRDDIPRAQAGPVGRRARAHARDRGPPSMTRTVRPGIAEGARHRRRRRGLAARPAFAELLGVVLVLGARAGDHHVRLAELADHLVEHAVEGRVRGAPSASGSYLARTAFQSRPPSVCRSACRARCARRRPGSLAAAVVRASAEPSRVAGRAAGERRRLDRGGRPRRAPVAAGGVAARRGGRRRAAHRRQRRRRRARQSAAVSEARGRAPGLRRRLRAAARVPT